MRYVLKAPKFDQESYLGYNIGIRPARKTGPRIEKEPIGDKIIFHNYGHAGYGVAMAYGACKITTNMLINEYNKKFKDISIVGSGYMGLFTAKILSEKGYNVTIYSKTLPSEWGVFGGSDKKLTSQIAAGKIICEFYDLFENKEQTKKIYEESMKFIKESFETSRYKGIYKRNYYMDLNEDPTKHFLEGSYDPVEKCKISFENGRVFNGLKTAVYNLDGDVFLNELVVELQKNGVNFVKKEFSSKKDILDLKDSVIFNCTGFQSKYLFNDTLVFALKGIMLSFKQQEGCDYYFDSDLTRKIQQFNIYSMNNRTSVGMTWIYEEDVSEDQDLKHRKVMLEVIEEFKQKYLSLAPKL